MPAAFIPSCLAIGVHKKTRFSRPALLVTNIHPLSMPNTKPVVHLSAAEKIVMPEHECKHCISQGQEIRWTGLEKLENLIRASRGLVLNILSFSKSSPARYYVQRKLQVRKEDSERSGCLSAAVLTLYPTERWLLRFSK